MTVVVENKRLTAVFDECLPLVMCYTNIRYGSNISRAQVIITNDMRSAWIPTAIFFYTPRSLHTNISCTRRAAGAEQLGQSDASADWVDTFCLCSFMQGQSSE